MRRFISKPHIVLYLVFLLLLTTSCSPKLDEQIKEYQEAHNSGDVAKEMSFLAEDISYEVVDQWTVTGKESVQKLAETDAVIDSQLIFTDVKASKNKVTCKVEEQNKWLKLAGIETLYYEFREFTFEKGLITSVRTKPTQEGAVALDVFRKSFGEWVAENRKEEFEQLRRASVITKDNIGKWLVLMQAWREEMEKEEQQKEDEKEKQQEESEKE
ncbi:MAG: hypothetical protein FVQ85_06505 [Planctomycetes bacterium]|nr:hypothetical protein [Planctomycetota bacterium]